VTSEGAWYVKKKPSVQRAKREARSSHESVLPKGGEPLAANQAYSDHNNHVAYFLLDVLEGSEGSEGGIPLRQPRVYKPHVLVRLHPP